MLVLSTGGSCRTSGRWQRRVPRRVSGHAAIAAALGCLSGTGGSSATRNAPAPASRAGCASSVPIVTRRPAAGAHPRCGLPPSCREPSCGPGRSSASYPRSPPACPARARGGKPPRCRSAPVTASPPRWLWQGPGSARLCFRVPLRRPSRAPPTTRSSSLTSASFSGPSNPSLPTSSRSSARSSTDLAAAVPSHLRADSSRQRPPTQDANARRKPATVHGSPHPRGES